MTVADGPIRSLFVGHGDKPYNVFVIEGGGRRFLGRKKPVAFDPEEPPPPGLSCLVGFDAIEGELLSAAREPSGYRLHYRPVGAEEARGELLRDPASIELTYPFKRLVGAVETAQSPSYWDARAADPDALDADEAFIRDQACAALRSVIAPGTLFDPACSTGRFLAAIGHAVPGSRLIGQDINPNMIEIARRRLDRAVTADAASPVCADGEADLVICRMLNLDVVTTEQARAIFARLVHCVAPRGWMLVIGHTPILLARDDMTLSGLEIVQSVMFTPKGHALYQFYLLRRRG